MAKAKFANSEAFIIRNGRLSFPNIFRKGSFEGKENAKFDAVIICDDQTEGTQLAIDAFKQVLKEGLQGKRPESSKYICLKNDEIRDGSDNPKANRDEYKGHWTLSAKNKNRFPCVSENENGKLIEHDEDSWPGYSGCRVDVKVSLFAGRGANGAVVGANLLALKFVGDDEPFGDGNLSLEEAVDGFGTLEDNTTADSLF